MKRIPWLVAASGSAFVLGILCHFLYQRWSEPDSSHDTPEGRSYVVTYTPATEPLPQAAELSLVQASDLRKLRQLAGSEVRVRGRVYRVGHSDRSNTYFLNFGPAKSALAGVIFSSAAELFERSRINLLQYEGREVEVTGVIKDDPKYGLEMILEDPVNIKVLN
jgi:hypothetical protein